MLDGLHAQRCLRSAGGHRPRGRSIAPQAGHGNILAGDTFGRLLLRNFPSEGDSFIEFASFDFLSHPGDCRTSVKAPWRWDRVA